MLLASATTACSTADSDTLEPSVPPGDGTSDDAPADAPDLPDEPDAPDSPDEPDPPDPPAPPDEPAPPQACTTTCNTTGTVGSNGMCVPPAEACNLIDDDCDGVCDESRSAGCRVFVHRGVSDDLGHLFTTDLAAVTTEPFRLEQQDNFSLYADDLPGSQTAYLCRKDDGTHLVTASAVCEGAGTVVLTLGNWATSDECGAVPLYRLWQAASNDHFYTLSPQERDFAVDELGYVFEGIPGYVWLEQ